MSTLTQLINRASDEYIRKYIIEVDNQSLDEEELIHDINQINDKINKFLETHKKHSLASNINLTEGLENNRKELENKLHKLRLFNYTSGNVFEEPISLYENIMDGLNVANQNINSSLSLFSIPSARNLLWKEKIINKYKEVNSKDKPIHKDNLMSKITKGHSYYGKTVKVDKKDKKDKKSKKYSELYAG